MSKGAFLRELTEAIAERAPAGKPSSLVVPGVGRMSADPITEIDSAAEKYMRRHGIEGSHRIEAYPEFDEEFARRVADEYGRAKHDPSDPRVRRSYDQMIDETVEQYRALKDTGLDIRFLKPGDADPYAASPALGYYDIKKNGRLFVFPTDQGYGSSTAFDPSENPLLKSVGKIGDKHDAVANDAFRVVHDAYGHFGPGNPFFRHKGEDRAWQHHARMFSDEALPAMTAETRGQNSWLNFGPHGEKNRTASGAETVFADQKATIMPKWVIEKDLGRLIKKFGIAGVSALLGYDVLDGLDEAQAAELHAIEAEGDEPEQHFDKGGAVKALMRLYHGTQGTDPKRVTEMKNMLGGVDEIGQGFEGLSPDISPGELGLHVGTVKQANKFAGYGPEYSDPDTIYPPEHLARNAPDHGRVVPLDVELENPLRLEDREGDWTPREIYRQLVAMGKVEEDPEFLKQLSAARLRKPIEATYAIRDLIEGLGHDGVVYKNRYETGLTHAELQARKKRSGKRPHEMTDEEFAQIVPEAEDSYIVWKKDKWRSPFGEGTGAGWSTGGRVSPLEAAYRR